jgi:sirohydrochlorin ferrochelatase
MACAVRESRVTRNLELAIERPAGSRVVVTVSVGAIPLSGLAAPSTVLRLLCRARGLSKVSARELAARSGLQIPLKPQGRFFLVEFDDHKTAPRATF